MKKFVFKATLLATVAALSFTACKKGEEDPAISLKSRDGRITEKWNLTKIEGARVTTKSTGTETRTTKLENGVYTVIGTSNTDTDRDTSTYYTNYSKQLEIMKGGEFTSTEAYTDKKRFSTDAINQSNSGYWAWGEDNKSKSQLLLDGNRYEIVRLSGKELTLQQIDNSTKNNTSTPNGGTGVITNETVTDETTWFYEKM